tara:strand:+ start:212 stop:1948 length:1737 start_codon:yes stop_codon:yes gene_type:complete
MKISKLLNKFFICSLIFFFSYKILLATEPVDIWKIEEIVNSNKPTKNINQGDDENNIKVLKTEKKIESIIVNEDLDSKEIKLAGLYDPVENGLNIDMWSNSDGKEIKSTLKKISLTNLSNFSEKILDIALLTNSYFPSNNISSDEFLDFKFEYLIQKKDFDLIKKFLIKNPSLNNSDKLIRFYTDFHLSNSQIDKSCEIFDDINLITDEYLINFKIYCLINQNKRDEAQLLFDLKSEMGSFDKFFTKKFNLLMGYKKNDDSISDKNILYLHLSHRTNVDFAYEPKLDTPKFIWKYLSTSNLLKRVDSIDLESSEEIKLIEKATNEGIYEEKDLLDLYKRFQFDINQLLNVNDIYKSLKDYEGRALLYQRLLLSVDVEQKLKFSSILKKSFEKSNLPNIFDKELSSILKKINKNQVPSNFTTFYDKNIDPDKIQKSKIKFNNKILHQSKLLNYFLNKTSLPKVEKETNDFLKKIKKNKKYSFTIKDIILVESLKSDGVQILKKYDGLYDYNSKMPAEINSMIINGESGLVLLKLVELIGEDQVENLDLESVSFIVGIMNELKTINLRNQMLLKVLPLKV